MSLDKTSFVANTFNVILGGVNNATGSVTISGNPTQGQTLTVSNTLADVNGLGTIYCLWQANGVSIFGATGSTYTLTNSEVNKAISVRAIYVDGLNNVEIVNSSATSAVVNINDAPVNSAVIALANGTEDTPYTVSVANLLNGFTDPDGDTISISALSSNTGTLVNNNNGTYTFTPNLNFNGTVTFNYNVIDGHGGTLAATSSVVITAVRDDLNLIGTAGNDNLNGDQIDFGSYDSLSGLGGNDILYVGLAMTLS